MKKEDSKVVEFSNELMFIKDSKIRQFAICCLSSANDEFFEKPASGTGRFHPKFADGLGGLVRHSRAVAMIMHDICEYDVFGMTDTEKDLLILAAITHDIMKYNAKSPNKVIHNHAELASQFIGVMNAKTHLLTEDEKKFVCRAVNRHMGNYGKTPPKTAPEKLLHIADMIASRKYLDIDFNYYAENKDMAG